MLLIGQTGMAQEIFVDFETYVGKTQDKCDCAILEIKMELDKHRKKSKLLVERRFYNEFGQISEIGIFSPNKQRKDERVFYYYDLNDNKLKQELHYYLLKQIPDSIIYDYLGDSVVNAKRIVWTDDIRDVYQSVFKIKNGQLIEGYFIENMDTVSHFIDKHVINGSIEYTYRITKSSLGFHDTMRVERIDHLLKTQSIYTKESGLLVLSSDKKYDDNGRVLQEIIVSKKVNDLEDVQIIYYEYGLVSKDRSRLLITEVKSVSNGSHYYYYYYKQ